MAEDWENAGFGLYIHWPFCEAKCPYCDFNSHVSRRIDQGAWKSAYLLELDRIAAETQGRVLSSVFFGGGTPSLMSPDTVACVIERIRHHWPVANDLEVTLEANPTSIEAGKFAAFRQGGVNRVSMGIQALNDDDLRRLGRLHSVADARKAYDIARDNFDRVSFDLIYARQNQSLADWRKELTEALNMAVDHLSLYQLTIEPQTAFGDRYKVGKLHGLPDEDLGADLYDLTQDLCFRHGMPAYEVSNHARDGAMSRHNIIYWRYGDYAGIGPGAHGRLTLNGQRYATETWSNPQKWLDAANAGTGEKPRLSLSAQDQASEFVLMGLRVQSGIDLDRYTNIAGEPLSPSAIRDLEHFGLVTQKKSNLYVTNQGVNVLNGVISKLLTD
ncbi:MAG: radical SAM family heme chaperone HemW [Roseobacter sp.]